MHAAATPRPVEPPAAAVVVPGPAHRATGPDGPGSPTGTADAGGPSLGMRGLSTTDARLRLAVHGANLRDGPTAADVDVVRDGRRSTIAAAGLVPGDLLLVGAGDVLPADGRLIAGAVVCDLTAVTADGRPVARTAGAASLPGGTTLQPDLVFEGTRALSGRGLVLVRHTGRRTLRGTGPAPSPTGPGRGRPFRNPWRATT